MSFWLNEPGAAVTITYEDGSTNSTFDGISSTATNLAATNYNFSLGAHTSYSISVYKLGGGAPALIRQSPALTPRGIDVNRHPTSPYFGRVYTSASAAGGIYALNPNLSLTFGAVKSAGVTWGNNGFSPYRVYVADDDYLMVGDASYTGNTGAANDGVWRLDPDLNSSQLFLGPKGEANGLAAGVFATVHSRPVLLGNPATNSTLMFVDGDFPAANGLNSLLVFSNINLSSLPRQTPADLQGPEVGLSIASRTLGGNSYPGLQVGNGYIYAGTFRANFSNPLLQVYQYDGANINLVWESRYNGNTADYFLRNINGSTQPTVDIAISPDGRYVAGVTIANSLVICPLTNGIPDVANIFTVTPTSTTGNARGIAFDAADNIYISSSGLGLVQSWTLGITTTSVTSGNASGATGFNVQFPATTVSVAATTPNASQGGVNGVVGTPIPGVFTISRTNALSDYSSPVTVNFTLSGTASNAVYTTSPSTGITPAGAGSVVLPPGVTSTNISIIPTTTNIPRPTTTVILSVAGGPAYSVSQPSSATVLIQNTSTNQIIESAAAATMYKAFAADFASVTLTRLGDTNVSLTIPAFAISYSGTAVSGVDFVPSGDVTFNPGDSTRTVTISPLSNSVPPVHVANPVYTGNKSVTLTVSSAAGYISTNNSSVLTLIDNAYPPAPVLFADPLTDPADALNWKITYGTGDQVNQGDNYNVQFGYDLTANNPDSVNNGLIGLPPNGATNALRITCNKNYLTTFAGGVNVYYTNQVFSNDYAVRFNMNLIEGTGLFTVEGAMFGINHNGVETNWWLGGGTIQPGSGPWASDGIWYWVQAPPGGAGGFGFTEFQEYTGAGGQLPNTGWTQVATVAALRNVYKRAVYSAPGGVTGGTPANNSPFSTTPADNNWSDVEIKQIKNVITMSINKTPIFVYTNTTKFTNGYVMLGYNAPLQGAFNQYVDTTDAAAYFSNLRVVSLTGPNVLHISDNVSGANNNVTILFSSNDGDDTTASFALQSASSVTGPYSDVGSAVITQVPTLNGTAQFQATATSTSSAQFYRIRHK